MSLNFEKLEKLRRLPDGSVRARCPACAAEGRDEKGEHLRIRPDGRFGCALHPGDSAHRKAIWALVGVKGTGTFEVRSLGRVGRAAQGPANPAILQKGILGRLGRVTQTLARSEINETEQGEELHNLKGFAESVPAVPEPTPVHRSKDESRPKSGSAGPAPSLGPSGDLRIPFDSDPRFHWWVEGGMTPSETRRFLEGRQ